MDKTRKVLSIIAISLTIILLVFSLMKKVGLCANTDTYIKVSDYPLPMGYPNRIGYSTSPLTEETLQRLVQTFNRKKQALITVYEVKTNGDIVVNVFQSDEFNGSGATLLANSVGEFGEETSSIEIEVYHYNVYTISTTGAITYNSNQNQSNRIISIHPFSNGNYDANAGIKRNTYIYHYPIAYYNYETGQFEDIKDANGNVIFKMNFSSGGDFDGQGFSQDYLDNLENANELPQVDTTEPDDTSSMPSWLKKILDAIGHLNKSNQAGQITIGQTIINKIQELIEKLDALFGQLDFEIELPQWLQDGINSIKDKIDGLDDKLADIKETVNSILQAITTTIAGKIDNLIDMLKPDKDAIVDAWKDGWNNSSLKAFIDGMVDIKGAFTTLSENGTATPPQITVKIPANNWNGQTEETTHIYDFSWYENIREGVVTLIQVLYYAFLGLWLFHEIPSIIHGVTATRRGVENSGNRE